MPRSFGNRPRRQARPLAGASAPHIDPGALRTPVIVQAQNQSQQQNTGELSPSWQTILTTHARVDVIKQTQQQQGGQLVSEVTHRITLRYPGPGIVINSGCRILCGAAIFQVQTVEDVLQRHALLNLMCVEINGGV